MNCATELPPEVKHSMPELKRLLPMFHCSAAIVPSTLDTIQQRPAAIASSNASGSPSYNDGRIKMSNALSRADASDCHPSRTTRSLSFASRSLSSRTGLRRPSPTQTTFTCDGSDLSSSQMRSGFFCSSSLAIQPRTISFGRIPHSLRS